MLISLYLEVPDIDAILVIFSNLVIHPVNRIDVAIGVGQSMKPRNEIPSEFFVEAQQLPSFFTEERESPLFIVDAEPEAIVGPKTEKKISVVTEI